MKPDAAVTDSSPGSRTQARGGEMKGRRAWRDST